MREPTFLLIIIFFIGLSPVFGAETPQTIHIKKSEIVRDLIVSISNPVLLEGTAEQGVFAAGSVLTISGNVTGDVAVIGGRLVLKEEARVTGDIILVGSSQEIAPTASIEGKLFTTPFLEKQIRQIFQNPVQFLFTYEYDFSFFAGRLFSSFLLFIFCIVLFKFLPAHITFAAEKLRSDFGYTASSGVVGFVGLMLLLMVSLALCLILIGIPLFILLLLFLLAAWLFGIASLFFITGDYLLKLFRIRRTSHIMPLLLVITLWTLLKFIPGVSLLMHMVVLILSIGVTLSTRFGTGTPWFRRKAKIHPSPESA